MRIALVVAHAEDFAIGINGTLPWYLPEDLRWFKAITLGKPIIMGRKTFESIGRPLGGRINIVISHQAASFREQWRDFNVRIVGSVDEALLLAERWFDAEVDVGSQDAECVRECTVIGGGQIYQQTLARAARIYLTRVHTQVPNADAFFPPWSQADWVVSQCRDCVNPDTLGPNYSFLILDRQL